MKRVGFIGAGRMGRALIRGFLKKGLLDRDCVLAYDKDSDAVKEAGVDSEYSAFEVVEKSDIVFLCVKPKDVDDVLDEIEDIAGSRLIVSVAAGITVSHLQKRLREARIIRVMPNTPALIHEVAAAYCLGERASEEDAVFVGGLFNSIGVAYRVEEELMDAVTAVSGSGPAYVYYFIDALTKAGVRHGLSEDVSLNLVLQTFRGATDMVIVNKKDPQTLIDEVKSPGGTTEAALEAFEKLKLTHVIDEAVDAAAKRSLDLGKR